MKLLHLVTFILLVVGGLNWLLFAVFGWELGANLLGGMNSSASMLVYILVGLSALVQLFTHKNDCKSCK